MNELWSKRITFTFLTQYYPPEIGATQARLASVVGVLRSKGHDVQVVTAMPNHLTGRIFEHYRGKFLLRENYDGVPVIRTWMHAASGLGIRRVLSYLSFAATSVIGLAFSRRADILYIDSPPLFLAIPGILVGRFRRMRIIFNVADLWPDSVRQLGAFGNPALFFLAEALERWSYRSVDVVCTVTTGIIRTLTTEKSVPNAKVVFLPNGVDTKLFAPAPPDATLQQRFGGSTARVFLFAGTHGAAHGLENVLLAAALLQASPAFFLFVGDGHRKPELRAMAERLNLTNVAFVDSRPLVEMPRYFSIAYASIVPLIEREVFRAARPQKMFPSLGAGVPIILSASGESAELIEQNRAGIVVKPESGEAIAAGCRQLMDNPDLRNELGANGRLLACRSFAWEPIIDQWLHDVNGVLLP